MTQPAYTDADVELVAGWFRRWLGASTIRQRDRDCAIEILGALAAAGRLLPAGTETREQWGTRLTWDGTTVEHLASDSRGNAQRRVDLHAKALREMPGWRATAELAHRQVHTTPWTVTEEPA